MPEYDGWYIAEDHTPETPDCVMVLVGFWSPHLITNGSYQPNKDGDGGNWEFDLHTHYERYFVSDDTEHYYVYAWKPYPRIPESLLDELEKRFDARLDSMQ